ncbi:LysM-like peptidoglycan-binding domain-containing protein [Vibrio rumoiensis]|uniref:Lysine transporter LysM n=1 Tax=Vibrio rumoiensis 1S-45 TaxID=1188252 RepID=A0A1E5DYZ5_9VIBR|nr:LysM-like peptidoglycan-binding domain-containing protein [Vibrio rumoiensis]OEF23008.1 hypothetical protein A1QC_13120 [Vibrio rumoiensis 1S-45]
MNQRNKNTPSKFNQAWESFTDLDVVIRVISAWNRLPKFHQRALTVLVPVVIVLLLLPSGSEPKEGTSSNKVEKVVPSRVTVPLIIDGQETNATKPPPKVEKVDQKRVSISGPQSNQESEPDKRVVTNNAGPEPWNNYTVKKGDTLSQVFRNNDLSLSDLNDLVAIEGKDKPLSQIQHGQLIRYKLTNRGDLDILQIEKDDGPVMFFRLSSGGFSRSQ